LQKDPYYLEKQARKKKEMMKFEYFLPTNIVTENLLCKVQVSPYQTIANNSKFTQSIISHFTRRKFQREDLNKPMQLDTIVPMTTSDIEFPSYDELKSKSQSM
jgi:hypothetical protein